MRPLLLVVGTLCIVAGLLPNGSGSNGTSEIRLGLFSPVFCSYRKVIESSTPATTLEDGERIESWQLSSTVYGWEIDVFSWSMALVVVGVVLLAVAIRFAVRSANDRLR